jgi:hypothetical protein
VRSFRACPRTALAGAAALALGASTAAATVAVSAGRYEGHTAQRGAVRLDVGSQGGRIDTYRLSGRFTCSGLPGHVNWRVGPVPGTHQTPIAIHDDGAFAATIHLDQRLALPGGDVRHVRGTYKLRGHFGSGPRARGRLRAVASGDGLRCDSRAQAWSARPKP